MNLLIKNIRQLVGILPEGILRLNGKEMSDLTCIENAWLLIENGLIADFGKMESIPAFTGETLDAEGKIILPAWCDSHSHIVYAGSRENEFVDRINGLSYEEIARRGGGILNSAKKLSETSEDELFTQAWQRLEEVQSFGTGALEIKSGYGLSFEGELKMLRVIKRLKENSAIPIKATFLGAHALPQTFKENREGYMSLLIDELLPVIAKEKLADYIDAFCEFGFFSAEETERLLIEGAKYQLRGKIHANQLNFSGGIQVGTKYNALSVDHLECVGEEEIACLKNSETMATLLPSAAFFLGLHYQPARKMIDTGLSIALASDYNPGSSPSGNMNFVLSLACVKLKMTPEEAINAATINGAYAMGLAHELGSITRGKKAHLILTKNISSYSFLPYSFGSNLIEKLIIK